MTDQKITIPPADDPMKSDSVDDLDAALRELTQREGEPPAMVIVDTLAANFGAGNESSTEDMGVVIANLQTLVRSHQTLMLHLHHSGHADDSRGRGSSVAPAALDVSLKVSSFGDLGVQVEGVKARDGRKLLPVRRRLEVVTMGQDDEGADITTVRLGLDSVKTKAFEKLDRMDQMLDFLRDDPTASQKAIEAEFDWPGSTARRLQEQAVDDGRLVRKGRKWQVIPQEEDDE